MAKSGYADRLTTITLRTFQVLAYAEGGLLPAILVVAVVHWVSGAGNFLVALVGATHGIVFTLYILLTFVVARLLHWSARMTSVAISVAFVPFATWIFEGRIHEEISRRIQQHS